MQSGYDWIITVRKHTVMDGIKIPVEMDATWKLNEGDWTWLKLPIEEIRYN